MIHKPGLGDFADRMTVLLLKLYHVAAQQIEEPRFAPWLEELEVCVNTVVGAPQVPAERLLDLYQVNALIWEGEDILSELGKRERLTSAEERTVIAKALQVRRLNRRRAEIVGELNGFNDKVTP